MSTMNFEKISAYIKSLPTVPDASLTPSVIIKWDKTKTTRIEWGGKDVVKTPIFYNPIVGLREELDKAPDLYTHDYLFDRAVDKSWAYQTNEKTSVTTPKKEIFSYYGKYHKEIDALEIACIVIDGRRSKTGEKRIWHYNYINEDRYFLFRNGEVFKGWNYLEKDGKFYNKDFRHWLRTDLNQNIHNRHFNDQALKFFGYWAKNEWGGERKTFWIPWRVGNWYEKCKERPVKSNSIKEKLLKDNSLPNYSNEWLNSALNHSQQGAICVPYEDGVLIRYFSDYNYYSEFNTALGYNYSERYRFFFNEKEAFVLKEVRITKNWAACSINNVYLDVAYSQIVGKENLKKVKRIDHCLDVLLHNNGNFSQKMFLVNLVRILKYPIIEKLCKAGYPYIASRIASNPTTNLKDFFNVTPKKTGSIYQNLGMNRIQLKWIENHPADRGILPKVSFLKEIGGKDLSHWDEKKTQKYFGFALEAQNNYEALIIRMNQLNVPTYVPHRELTQGFILTEEDKRNINKLVNLQAKSPNVNVVRLFRDTVYMMCNQINEILPNMNPYEAKSFRDLKWMHDEYVALSRSKVWNKTINMEKWNFLNEKRIKLYERIGDEFEIIVPRKPEEIVTEGATLNHCVGSYVDSVASGYKTILFLRKKSQSDIPFYTIEINDLRVIQIHGNHNRWLGNNPEAIQFVVDWLKDVKIRCTLNILFNLGQGYDEGKECLDHSSYKLNEYVDA